MEGEGEGDAVTLILLENDVEGVLLGVLLGDMPRESEDVAD